MHPCLFYNQKIFFSLLHQSQDAVEKITTETGKDLENKKFMDRNVDSQCYENKVLGSTAV